MMWCYYEEIYHHGIKGQRWGIRRFQNEDGSLTNRGQKHRDVREGRDGDPNSEPQTSTSSSSSSSYEREQASVKKGLSKGVKTALVLGGVAAATTVAVLATRKFNIEKRALDNVLGEYGNKVAVSRQKLSNRLMELERGSKYADKTGTQLKKMAERSMAAAQKRESGYREVARKGAGAARYLNDMRLDSLAAKANVTGRNVTNADFARMMTGQTVDYGKEFLRGVLGLKG